MQSQGDDSEKYLEYWNSNPSTYMLGQAGRVAGL